RGDAQGGGEPLEAVLAEDLDTDAPESVGDRLRALHSRHRSRPPCPIRVVERTGKSTSYFVFRRPLLTIASRPGRRAHAPDEPIPPGAVPSPRRPGVSFRVWNAVSPTEVTWQQSPCQPDRRG